MDAAGCPARSAESDRGGSSPSGVGVVPFGIVPEALGEVRVDGCAEVRLSGQSTVAPYSSNSSFDIPNAYSSNSSFDSLSRN